MIPTFDEIVSELNICSGVLVCPCGTGNEWTVFHNEEFVLKTNSCDPTDEFLKFYISICSIED